MQSTPDIDDLIVLYLTGRASPEQRERLETWMKASDRNRAVFEKVKSVWTAPASTELNKRRQEQRDRIWSAGTADVPTESRQLASRWWLRAAASVLIVVAVGWGATQWMNEAAVPIAMIEMSNAAGMKSSYTLMDGTEVWLNAESTLRYPEQFSDTLRWVELVGEAFFDVTPDADRPFVVKAGNTRTEVLGTAFNIEAYDEHDYIKVSLLEGKVNVQNSRADLLSALAPGEQLLFSTTEEEFSIQRFDYALTFGWKDGTLMLDGADLETFRQVLEKWYGVNTVIIGDPGRDWEIRARYDNENLENVMRDVAFNKNFSYELNGNNLIMNFNTKAMP